MPAWIFEPGHTAAEFCVRHMMVTWVRGHFKDVHGRLEFDPANPATLALEATLSASTIWTGEAQRDEHLRSVVVVQLAPWILGKPPGETFELLFLFLMVVLGIVLMYLFGRYWQS